ncbi:MAG: UDP-3-O-(3-hydroxymyristoyl)glucosamine N-acyltransferase, partial [Muribaculaceae bacterium]|nr:UDP-3-O-(3-hydroxymyristoyl)glucosamine N-acyltransferase [Muribaculaceae bacterium]
GSNCMVGGQVGFAGHITVGDRVQIGAQSGIAKSVENDARIMGSPAIPMGEWARMIAAQKNLVELTRRVAQLEKALASENKNK